MFEDVRNQWKKPLQILYVDAAYDKGNTLLYFQNSNFSHATSPQSTNHT